MKKQRISLAILALAAVAIIFTLFNRPTARPVLGSMFIDVNPSIELKINNDFEVESLKALNQEAVEVLTGYVLQEDQDDIEDVVEALVQRLVDLDYLQTEKENMILVTGDKHLDKKILEVANASIKQYLRIKKIEAKVAMLHSDLSKDEQQQADELKISSGKYELIKQLLKSDDDLNLFKLAKLEVKELYDMAINETGKDIVVVPETSSDDNDDQQTVVKTPEVTTPKQPEKVENKKPVVTIQPEVKDQPKPVVKPVEPKQPEVKPEPKPVAKPVITTKEITETKTINFKTITKNDANLTKGTSKVSQAGVKGSETWTYLITYQDGKQVSKKLISQTVTKPAVDKIVLVGTKEAVTQPTTSTRLSAKAARDMVTNRFGGAVQKIEYTYNERNPLYKGEARKAGYKVVFEINARTKQFVKWDIGNDSEYKDWAKRYQTPSIMTQAADKVVARTGVSHSFVQKIEFKWDASEPLFQGEAFSKGYKYSFEMYAKDLSFKKFDRSGGDETWSKQYFNVLSR